MEKPIECRYRNETAIGDFCEFNKVMCEEVYGEDCYSIYVSSLIVKCQNDIDELSELLDDDYLRTFGDYLEVLRNGF